MIKRLLFLTFLIISTYSLYGQGSNSNYPLRSIPTDKITKCFVEFGGGVGADYLILWGSFNANLNIYPIQFKHFKMSINNEVGIMLPWARILYYYPSTQIHFPIKDYWFLIGVGREYTEVKNSSDEIFNRVVDYRIDLGLKVYASDYFTTTFTVPIRIDDEITAYYTGILIKINFRI